MIGLLAAVPTSPAAVARGPGPLAPSGPAGTAQPPVATFRAGVGVVDATWNVGASAGQYASSRAGIDDLDPRPLDLLTAEHDPHLQTTKRAPSYGVASRLSIRAIVVEGADGERVALVKSDNYLAQDLLARRVADLLRVGDSGITADRILHTATHNHSSPYYSTPAWGVWLFQDVMDLRMFEYQARAMRDAIEQAAAGLVPATLGGTVVTYSATTRNAPGPAIADDGTPAGYPLEFNDHDLTVLRFDDVTDPSRPVPLATWMSYGEHPESLDGYDLVTADYVGHLERLVGRETGAPLVFSQGAVGSAERANDASQVLDDGTIRAFSHQGHAQAERSARQMADAVIAGWVEIGGGGGTVPATTDVPVAMTTRWFPGPVSHPLPGVSNCRTDPTLDGDPGAPILGLPDCARSGELAPGGTPLGALLDDAGVPVPDHYHAPSLTAVEENARLMLQVVRLGEIVLASCACEPQVDMILNLKSRLDQEQGNMWLGFDWSEHCDARPDGDWDCADPRRHDLDDRSLVVPDDSFHRMRAQVRNDAAGWEDPANLLDALSEPSDPTRIRGNFTHEELTAELGYALPVGIGHGGDYNGYTVSYREFMNRDHYRKALTAYGPHTADYMVTRLVRMAGELNGGPPPDPEPLQLVARLDEVRQRVLAHAVARAAAAALDTWTAALPDDVGPAESLAQPADITRFDAATYTWRGGTTFVDNPEVRVERRMGGVWTPFADQTGEVQTIVDLPTGTHSTVEALAGGQEWRWTASFEAFSAFPARLGSTPEGTYRFVVDGHHRDGGSTQPYRLTSEPFTVRPWDGIDVSDLQLHDDGTASFAIAPVEYPRSYDSPIRMIADDGGDPICRTCTFRPWARTAAIAEASITVERAAGGTEVVAARRHVDRWVVDAALQPGDHVRVRPGSVVDEHGEVNGVEVEAVVPGGAAGHDRPGRRPEQPPGLSVGAGPPGSPPGHGHGPPGLTAQPVTAVAVVAATATGIAAVLTLVALALPARRGRTRGVR